MLVPLRFEGRGLFQDRVDGPFSELLDGSRSGLLRLVHDTVPVVRKGGSWSFVHKTVMEYFAARQTQSGLLRCTALRFPELVDRLVRFAEDRVRVAGQSSVVFRERASDLDLVDLLRKHRVEVVALLRAHPVDGLFEASNAADAFQTIVAQVESLSSLGLNRLVVQDKKAVVEFLGEQLTQDAHQLAVC